MTDTTTTPPHTEAGARRPRPALKIAVAFLVPLFFVVVFPLAFVSAIHSPTPHNLSLLVVGPEQVVSQIASGLDATDEFAATSTDVVEDAQASVRDRTVEGSILIAVNTPEAGSSTSSPTFTVTTYVANAEGRSVAATVQATGDKVAGQLGTTATVVDVAPLAVPDPLGVNLFYLLTYTSLGAYLVIIVLMQVMPKARLATRFLAVTITSIAAPLLVFGLSSIFVGDYGASFGTIVSLLGVNALYVFTVGSLAVLIEQFLGRAATFGVMGLIVFLNFPSAGGATPASLLPPFWQAIHSVYFGSGAYESFRSIVYFDGNGAARWILQLIAWTVGLLLVNFVVYQTKTVRAQRRQIAGLLVTAAEATAQPTARADRDPLTPDDEPVTHKHIKFEPYELDHAGHLRDEPAQRSITTGEGAGR